MIKGIMMTTVAIALFAVSVSDSARAQDQIQAGVSAAVRGDVQVARADAVGRQVNSGEAIFLEDGIASGPNSGMQVLLLDETVFTIGPESEISIDEFVYDPARGEGSLVASMAKGTMRFVTGNIAAGTPENMSIKLPVGTIGIRGTTGVAVVLTQQQAQQQFPDQAPQGGPPGQPVVFAALTGPGPLANAGSGTGSFNFSTPNGDVDLNRPGSAVLATPGQPPVFFIAPPGAIQGATAGLRGGTGGSDDAGDAGDDQGADDQSGSDDATTSDDQGTDSDSSDTAGNDGDGSSSGGLDGDGGSSTVSNSGVGNDTSFNEVIALEGETQTTNETSDIVSDVSNSSGNTTTFSDIADNFGNSGTASGSGSLSGSVTGTFNTFIDFSARTVDVQTGTLSQGGGTIGTVILNSGSGVAVGAGSTGFSIGSGNNTGTCSSCTGSVAFTSPNSMSLSVEHAGGSGTGSATYQ